MTKTRATNVAISGGLTQEEFQLVYDRAVTLEREFGEMAARMGGVKKKQWDRCERDNNKIKPFNVIWNNVEYGRQRLT